MRIPSGVTDQYIYFVAVDSTDFTTRETGLSSFTVYRSRNGGAAAAMTTPTINETDATNMPGVYELLLDEDMTIDSGDDSQEMVFHITHAGMHPVTRTIEIYRPKITAGNTLGVASDGDVSGNVDGNVVGSVASVTGAVGSVTGAVGSVTGNVGGNVVGSIGSLAAQAKLDVNAEADTALADYDAPTKTEMDAAFTEIKGATWASGTDTLEAIRDRGDAAWITATGFSTHSAADVWAVGTRVLTAGTNIVLAKGTGITGFNDLSAAQVNSEVDQALIDVRLDELLAADSDIDGAAPPTVGSVFHELMTKATGSFTYDQTTDSLEALRDRGDAAWITATGFSTHSAADVWTSGTRTLTANTNLNDPTAAAIADAVWDELRSGHVTAGSFGEGVASVQGNVTGSVASVTGAVGSVTGNVGGIAGTIQTLDALDTAQDTQHSTTQSNIAALNNLSTSDIDARLAAIGLDHLVSAAVTGTDITDNSIIAKLVSSSATADWDTYVNTTDALQAIRDRGDAAWITATGFSTHSAADVWTSGTRTLTANTNLNDPTAAAIADAVWDELQADHVSAGSFGEIATEIAAILVDTDTTIPAAIAALNNLSQADIRTAVGLASANLDTQLGNIPANVWGLSNGIEAGYTPKQAMRLILAEAAGELSTPTSTQVLIKSPAGTVNRIDATVNSSGERTSITHDVSDEP